MEHTGIPAISEMVRLEVECQLYERDHPHIHMYVLPGGTPPKRMTDLALGYDVRLRALVDPEKFENEEKFLRKTLCNFVDVIHPDFERNIELWPRDSDGMVVPMYRVDPFKKALCAIGVALSMPYPVGFNVQARSGLATREDIMVSNGPGLVDSDYTGEACVHLYNTGNKAFWIWHNMRVAQILFIRGLEPRFVMVNNHSDLVKTQRGADGLGSTGVH